MFNQLRLSTRLTVGGGGAVALIVLVASLAAYQMHRLSQRLDELVNDQMVKVEKFSQLKNNLHTVSALTRNMFITSDPQVREAEKKKIDPVREQNTELLATLDKLVTEPEGREHLKVMQESREPFKQRLRAAMALNAQGDREAAGQLLLGGVDEVQQQVFRAVDASTELQRAQAVRSAQEAKEASASATVLFMVLAGVMAAMGAVLTWMLVRHLNHALGAEPAELGEVAQRVAAGDLSPVPGIQSAPSGSVLASLGEMQTALALIVGRVRASSASIATGSTQIAMGNVDLSQRTEEQASNLQQTAMSMEQISSTVRTSAETANQACDVAASASSAAVKGGGLVADAVHTMQDIATASGRIADIIGVIDGIAFQTNILALNAAVEAARAGEQGRGFAVVASEVRTLAGRSADAAKEIKSLISASVEKVESGVRQVNDAGASMEEIVSQVQRVSQMINELSDASASQSVGIRQIGDSVTHLDQVTQQNAALVEQSAAAAESLKGQAAKLAELVNVFRV